MTRTLPNDPGYHVISLKTNKARLMGAEILIDGQEVKGVRKITIKAEIMQPTIVEMEMIANVNYDGQELEHLDLAKSNPDLDMSQSNPLYAHGLRRRTEGGADD